MMHDRPLAAAATSDLAAALASDVPDAQVLAGAEVARYLVDGVLPSLAVLPRNVESVTKVMDYARTRGLVVIPWGSGNHIDLGNRPSRADILLDLSELNALIEHQPAELVVTVQAGMTLGSLKAVLAEQGQMLALEPPLA
ncbi:MAG: FAD-binding oxidoreductase, partial [Dehalococcoidia bacterium]